jgi:hypothetical protein
VNVTLVAPNGGQSPQTCASLLNTEAREAARREANQWIKRLRQVRYDATPMRARFTYKGDSLWWFTELYLHKMKRLETAVETVLALEVARDRGATSLIVETDSEVRRQTAAAFGAAHGLPVDVRGRGADRTSSAISSLLIGVTAPLSRVRRARVATPPHHPRIAAFVHSAFWRSAEASDEGYIGPVLDALAARVPADDLYFVGLGPRRNFRARRWWDPLTPGSASPAPFVPIEQLARTESLRGSLALWRQRRHLAEAICRGSDIRDAAMFRGCDLWPVLRHELDEVARVQWPWSARAMDEASAALDCLQPQVVATYAEAGGWGRALILESRRRHVPSIGIQHGFIYRHWLNYLHEPDELSPLDDGGFPLPDRTLLFDDYAAEHLKRAGNLPASRLAVTGSARLEDLLARFPSLQRRREELRIRHGVPSGGRLAVIAAKFSEIRQELPSVVSGAAALPDVRVVIKTHPAETSATYDAVAAGQPHVTVVDARSDLAELLAAADTIVTRNSTVAIDGLVLGIPTLVVGLPTNLSPFVSAGVMAGADGADHIRERLQSVLYDLQVRQQLLDQAERFVARYRLQPEPGAARRAADEILSLARDR